MISPETYVTLQQDRATIEVDVFSRLWKAVNQTFPSRSSDANMSKIPADSATLKVQTLHVRNMLVKCMSHRCQYDYCAASKIA